MPKLTKQELTAFVKTVKDDGKERHFTLRVDGPGVATVQASGSANKLPGAIHGKVARTDLTFIFAGGGIKKNHLDALKKCADSVGGKQYDFILQSEGYDTVQADDGYGDTGALLDENSEDASAEKKKSPVEKLKDVLGDRIEAVGRKIDRLQRNDAEKAVLAKIEAAFSKSDPDLKKVAPALKALEQKVRQRSMDKQLSTAADMTPAQLRAANDASARHDEKAELEADWAREVEPNFEILCHNIAEMRGKAPGDIIGFRDQFRKDLARPVPDVDRAKKTLVFFLAQKKIMDKQGIDYTSPPD